MRYVSVIFLLFSCAGICRPDDTSANRLLAKAKYFVDLYNWDAASPLFRRAEINFEKSGDRRNAFYAHVGTLHLISKLPLIQRSEELERLRDPVHRVRAEDLQAEEQEQVRRPEGDDDRVHPAVGNQ